MITIIKGKGLVLDDIKQKYDFMYAMGSRSYIPIHDLKGHFNDDVIYHFLNQEDKPIFNLKYTGGAEVLTNISSDLIQFATRLSQYVSKDTYNDQTNAIIDVVNSNKKAIDETFLLFANAIRMDSNQMDAMKRQLNAHQTKNGVYVIAPHDQITAEVLKEIKGIDSGIDVIKKLEQINKVLTDMAAMLKEIDEETIDFTKTTEWSFRLNGRDFTIDAGDLKVKNLLAAIINPLVLQIKQGVKIPDDDTPAIVEFNKIENTLQDYILKYSTLSTSAEPPADE